MGARRRTINLNGKTLRQVIQLLQRSGFDVSTENITKLYDGQSSYPEGRAVKGTPVHVIWIDPLEAPLLTVTIFNGTTLTLEGGMDLHLFGDQTDIGNCVWSAVFTGTMIPS